MNPSAATGALLLCLDLQPAFLNAMPDGALLLRRCAFAIEAAQGLGIPVVFTEQVPQKLGGTAPELLALVEKPVVWGKTAFSAFADDGIRDELRRRAAEHLLICGLESPVCIYQTALEAIESQYLVTVLTDCAGARRPDDARAALAALQRGGVHLLPAETVFYALLHDAGHPFFKTYTQLVKKYG
jgi:nicotinamidase-related amidase